MDVDSTVEFLEVYWMLIPMGFVGLLFGIAINAAWEGTDWGTPLAVFGVVAMSVLTLLGFGFPITLLVAGGMVIVMATTLKSGFLILGGLALVPLGLGAALQFSFDDPLWAWSKEQEAIAAVLDLAVVGWVFEGPWYEQLSRFSSVVILPLLLVLWLLPRLALMLQPSEFRGGQQGVFSGLGSEGGFSINGLFNRGQQAPDAWNGAEGYRPTRVTEPRRQDQYLTPSRSDVLNDTDLSIWERSRD